MTVGTWGQRGARSRRFDVISTRVRRFVPPALWCTAILSLAAGIAHAVAVPMHRDWPAGAAFFAVVAAFQIAFAVEVIRRPTKFVLRAGVYAGVAILALYGLSRTLGTPVGPHPWTPEDIGALDLFASIAESALVLCLFWLSAGQRDTTVRFGPRLAVRVWLTLGVLAIGLASALPVGAHSHASGQLAHTPDLPMPGHRLEEQFTGGSHRRSAHSNPERSTCDFGEGEPVSLQANNDPARATALAYSHHGALVVYEVSTDTATSVISNDHDCSVGDAVLRDERAMIFTSDSSLYQIDLPTGTISQIEGPSKVIVSAWNPDRTALAFTSWVEDWSQASLSIFDPETSIVRVLRVFPRALIGRCGWQGDEGRVEWSRDGSKILVTHTSFDDENGTIFLTDLAGADLTAPRYGTFARWLADSRTVVYESLASDLDRRWRLLDTATGQEEVLPIEGWRFRPQLSPDGSRLAYDDGGYPDLPEATIMVFDLATKKEHTIASAYAGAMWLDDATLMAQRTGPCGEFGCHDGNWEHQDVVDRIDVETGSASRLSATTTMWSDVLYGRPTGETLAPAPPAFVAHENVSTSPLEDVTFTVRASDPEGKRLRYRASGLPEGASFDASSRRFTWKPRIDQQGRWPVEFAAIDSDGLRAHQTVVITVRPLTDGLLELIGPTSIA